MAILATGMITLVDLNDAKSLTSYINSNSPKVQIFDPNNNTHSPNWPSANVVLTPEMYVTGTASNIINQAKSITWYENNTLIVAGSGYAIGATNPKALTISANKLNDAKSTILYVCEIVWRDEAIGADITVKTEIEFSRVKNGLGGTDGANAISAVLSNDADVIPTDSAGNNGNFAGALTVMTIYEGATDVSASWVVSAVASGVTGTLVAATRTYTVTAMTADTGYVDLTATRSGYSPIKRRFALSKSKQGIAGTTPSSYWLVSSSPALSKTLAGAYTPTTLTFSGKTQVGTAAPIAYAGRFIIEESTDGTTFVAKYTSAANEASKVHTPTAGIKAVKVKMYVAGAVTNLLDEQIIVVVSDGNTGAAGVNSVIASVWCPNGAIVKNNVGSVTAQCDVYNGTALLTSGVTYQWYKYISGVWVLLSTTVAHGTTGWVTDKLTITASSVESLSSFKCIAKYASKSYEDVASITDLSDPIQIVITSAEGNVYKNGEGTKNLTAKVYQAGDEMDIAGTTYEYRWTLRNEAGVVDTAFIDVGKTYKVGKSIVVPAISIKNIGNLVMELWTK